MAVSSIDLALRNCTTVENLTRRTKIWQLAVYSPKLGEPERDPATVAPGMFRKTYPSVPKQTRRSSTTSTSEEYTGSSATGRTFAVLMTQPGENPWDLGPYENWKSIMGNNVLDWVLPIKHSPCTDHSHGEAAFALGPVVERLRQAHGLVSELPSSSDSSESRRSHRRRRRSRTVPKAKPMNEKADERYDSQRKSGRPAGSRIP